MTRTGVVSLGLVVCALAVVVGCKKEEGAAPDAGPSTTASATAAAVSASPAASAASVETAVPSATADIDNLPAPGTHTAAAAKSVTTANYKTELDTIEKQLNGVK